MDKWRDVVNATPNPSGSLKCGEFLTGWRPVPFSRRTLLHVICYTGLFKMIVGVLTTCHTQYTWDSSTCIFLFNRTTLQVFVTYLTGALYVHPLWFYKHQHKNRVRSKLFVACQHIAFSLPFAAILVNCAPNGEMHNYCTPHIIKENFGNFLIHQCNYILLSQVYCVWQVVKTLTIILITLYFTQEEATIIEKPIMMEVRAIICQRVLL